MIIRRFETEDLDEVLTIESNTFKERETIIYDLLCEINTNEFLVAVENNKIVGYVIGYIFSENEGRISSIAVQHEYRNRGIGAKLLYELLYIFHRKYLKYVYLEVRIGNKKAQQMYRRAGFKPYCIEKRYYLDGDIGIFMRKKFYMFSYHSFSKRMNESSFVPNELINISYKKMNDYDYKINLYISMQDNLN